jgi:NADP-dependent 3-hydroxy acid dehydrogenase YdfG
MVSKVVLITGCSSGVGQDLAVYLTKKGYTVAATARNVAALASSPAALKLALDVTDQTSVDAAVRETIERLGGIDILINNAGFSVRGAMEEVDEVKARAVFDVNVWGLLRVTRAVLPHMRERKSGRVVHIGSVVGKFVWPLNGAYAASKHAVEAMTDAMRLELYPFRIKVVLIEPGTIDSAFLQTSENLSAAIFSRAVSPYAPLYRRFQELAALSGNRGAKPRRISKVVLRAIRARHPRARYLAAASVTYRFAMAAGDGLRDRLLRRVFQIR